MEVREMSDKTKFRRVHFRKRLFMIQTYLVPNAVEFLPVGEPVNYNILQTLLMNLGFLLRISTFVPVLPRTAAMKPIT